VDTHIIYNFTSDDRFTGSQTFNGTADCGTGPFTCQTSINIFGDRAPAAVVGCAATSEVILRRVRDSIVDKQKLEAPHR
jgi:hypothetical protein